MTDGSTDREAPQAPDPKVASETLGFNLIPFASIAGGWLGPLVMFWLYVGGPLRPFDYPGGDLFPPLPVFIGFLVGGVAVWWLPASYYQIRVFEQSGRLYELLGVRLFRWFVPDGDAANEWRRRREPAFRIIRNRRCALAFRRRTELSEATSSCWRWEAFSAAFAWMIGWPGWAVYLGVGNVLGNLYPVLLQRYTRARLMSVAAGRHKRVLAR